MIQNSDYQILGSGAFLPMSKDPSVLTIPLNPYVCLMYHDLDWYLKNFDRNQFDGTNCVLHSMQSLSYFQYWWSFLMVFLLPVKWIVIHTLTEVVIVILPRILSLLESVLATNRVRNDLVFLEKTNHFLTVDQLPSRYLLCLLLQQQLFHSVIFLLVRL